MSTRPISVWICPKCGYKNPLLTEDCWKIYWDSSGNDGTRCNYNIKYGSLGPKGEILNRK